MAWLCAQLGIEWFWNPNFPFTLWSPGEENHKKPRGS